MTYHPDAEWLRDHGKNPEKARCVELANARNFLKWTREQPWMALHELSHGYHHQFLKRGFENPEIKKAFDDAMRAKRYDSVLRSNGKKEKAYAATNPMEYFAEASEAYFGNNDFYPFDRAGARATRPQVFRTRRQSVAQGLNRVLPRTRPQLRVNQLRRASVIRQPRRA